MIQPATEAYPEAIYQLLYAARDEIPLNRIATDPKDGWSTSSAHGARARSLLVAELDGEVVGVMTISPRRGNYILDLA